MKSAVFTVFLFLGLAPAGTLFVCCRETAGNGRCQLEQSSSAVEAGDEPPFGGVCARSPQDEGVRRGSDNVPGSERVALSL